MMTKTHISVGCAVGLAVAKALGMHPGPEYITAIAIGSMLPDIDHPGSKINRKILPRSKKIDKMAVYTIMAIVAGYLYLKNSNMGFALYTIPLFLMIAFSKHRGITHSILGSGIFIFSIYSISNELGRGILAIPFALGYLMHIVSDMLTSAGVQLFYPAKKRIKFLFRFKTNSTFEKVLMYIATAVSIYMGLQCIF
ncbi:inner membrane protein [Peptoclostridium litorale DSM 5388]|uniref:Membrane-bound metal-dependent hydrolase n=1 Tax=Peptoclostridium litorale DSM 5388 TaxID=1121324 RepID=A0A069RFF5_PEPLI|nr:metal-dependent hydrolase [Peptoclostridium litorale]KDR94930.1 hypothetical protein CLIT_13c02520 [Peptoclostridium litorale DSM 5388]SIN95930.1 inner membrane protein [Peptoclostridium litorale DSM 5388]